MDPGEQCDDGNHDGGDGWAQGGDGQGPAQGPVAGLADNDEGQIMVRTGQCVHETEGRRGGRQDAQLRTHAILRVSNCESS